MSISRDINHYHEWVIFLFLFWNNCCLSNFYYYENSIVIIRKSGNLKILKIWNLEMWNMEIWKSRNSDNSMTNSKFWHFPHFPNLQIWTNSMTDFTFYELFGAWFRFFCWYAGARVSLPLYCLLCIVCWFTMLLVWGLLSVLDWFCSVLYFWYSDNQGFFMAVEVL